MRATNELIHASENGHVEIARLLLEVGTGKDLRDDTGNTALMHAARNGHVEVVRLLVDAGAKTDLQNGDSYSALRIRSLGWPRRDRKAAFGSWC